MADRIFDRYIAHHAWCERCMRLVGRPRVTKKESRADLTKHRMAGHPQPAPGETVSHLHGRDGVVPEPTDSEADRG